MVKHKLWKVITVLFKIFLGISASTHWVVTENGKIQPQLDSVFHMRRPYDLLSLLDQEYRANEIERLYHEMVRRKAIIDEEWAGLESATEVEARLYTSDLDCLRAGKPLTDFDLYVSVAEDGVGREDVSLDELSPTYVPSNTPDQPDCSTFLNLEFSMRTFPHLQVLSWNLTSEPERLGNVKSLSARSGRQIAAGLSRNHTSWFLYNLAALYWRTQGDAQKALQCAKRAVYLSPRQHRDAALLNLGCIVQQAHCPAEAAILLHATIDHAPLVSTAHFALANVYAILGDYNRSVACYDNALKIHPYFPIAQRNRFAVLCHHKLENSLYQLHRSLQGILGQLHDYHNIQEHWLKHQEQLIYQQAPLEVKLQDLQQGPLKSLLAGESCVQTNSEGTSFTCNHNKLLAHHLQIDITLSLQLLLKNVETQAKKITEQMSWRLMSKRRMVPPKQEEDKYISGENDSVEKSEVDIEEDDGGLEIFVETVEDEPEEKTQYETKTGVSVSSSFLSNKYLKLNLLKDVDSKVKDSVMGLIEEVMESLKIDRQMLMPEQQCKLSNFNSETCTEDMNHWQLPNPADESRQIKILQIAQSLGIVEEGSWLQNTSSHVIGTIILTCIQLGLWNYSEIPATKNQPQCSGVPGSLVEPTADSFRHTSPEPRLKAVFHALLLDDETSLASYLSHALKDKSKHEPSFGWLLETAAALYWRCVGDTQQMITCLQAAVHKAPPDLKDIPLHHVAHILLTLGHRQEALVLASLALKVSPHSINANMVLFHTYLAMGEPENAKKYGKASIALYQQTQGATSP